MTKTDNLKLNCWTAEDPIRVAELSENFRAIDKAQQSEKLMELSDNTGGGIGLEVDLSKFDLTKYRRIDVVSKIYTATTGSCSLRLNGLKSNIYFAISSPGSASAAYSSLGSLPTCYPGRIQNATSFVSVHLVDNHIFVETKSFYSDEIGNIVFGQMKSLVRSDWLQADALKTLNFDTTANNLTAPGSKICVYGVLW